MRPSSLPGRATRCGSRRARLPARTDLQRQARVAPDALVYAMLLTPAGQVAHDFFLTEADGGFLIDIDVGGPRRF